MDGENAQKLSDKIRRQLEKLDNQILEQIYQNNAKAVEYFKKGFGQVSVEELNNRSLEDMAHEMQLMAKLELNLRSESK